MPRPFLILALLPSLVLPRAANAQNADRQSAQESVTKPLTGPRQTVAHRGFTIDVTEVTSAPDYASVIAAMKGQLDVVANATMPAAAQAFFRTVPIVMQAITGRPRYGAGRVVIPLRSEAPYASDRPIVLHELCHAYHDRKLAGGFSHPTIIGFYEQAKQSGRFPSDSYMLSSITEYFAMMASVFLHGSAARDPFVRDSIRTKQPAMYDWLVREFGQRAAPPRRNPGLAFGRSRNGPPDVRVAQSGAPGLRHPERGPVRIVEAPGHEADHDGGLLAHQDRGADQVAPPAEAALPESVAQDRDVGIPPDTFFR